MTARRPVAAFAGLLGVLGAIIGAASGVAVTGSTVGTVIAWLLFVVGVITAVVGLGAFWLGEP